MRDGTRRDRVTGIAGRRLGRIALPLVLLTAAGSNGCGDPSSSSSGPDLAALHSSSAPEDPRGPNGSPKPVMALEHDFGLVRPGETLRHEFTVRNSTSSTWTLRQIVTTCACTVTRASAGSIPPGGAERFEGRYRMPSRSADKSQTITILTSRNPTRPRYRLRHAPAFGNR